MSGHNNEISDISALFDPNSEDPIPVVPLGALPPSWAAAARRAEPSPDHTSLAWSQAPATPLISRPVDAASAPSAPDQLAGPDDHRVESPSKRRDKRAKKRDKKREPKSDLDRQRDAAKKRVDRVRKHVRLRLIGTEASVTRTRSTSTVWYVQRPGPWNMRPVAVQERYINNEALVLAKLSEAGVTSLHRRVVRTPWPVRQWAQAHDQWATPIPDVPGALSWADYLRGHQHAMLWPGPTLKGRYWGIELPARSVTGQAIDGLSKALKPTAHWPVLGSGVRSLQRLAEGAFDREQQALEEYLEQLDQIMSSQGVAARRATPAEMDYLLRRSATIGLPLDVEGVIAGGGDWDELDIAAIEDLADVSLTPGDGYTTVSGVIDGRRYTRYVVVLTVGRMGALPIPEKMLPWQVIGDPSGEPLEWNERIILVPKERTIFRMNRQVNMIEAQYNHYQVEHDTAPPQELREQYQLAKQVVSDVEEDHSGMSARTEGWYRIAVAGRTPDEAREKAARLKDMYAPQISLETEHGQYQLLREFIPGEPLANIANCRRMSVRTVAAGMAAVGDRIGDRTGVVLGQTGSIAPRPAVWDLFAAHERKHKSGLTPIVAIPGSGKTFLAGMIVYQAVRAGAYAVILDPSGPLRELAFLPEFRDIAEVYALTGRSSRPGSLNPYRVIIDPRPDDDEYQPNHPDFRRDADPLAAAKAKFDADLRAAAAERISVAVSVLKMMLPPGRMQLEWTESVLWMAANRVGGDRNHNLREVLDMIRLIGETDDNEGVRACARAILQDLEVMSQLSEARVLFPDIAGADGGDFDSDHRLTILTMPGLQLPPEGVDPSLWTPQQRMAAPLMHMAAWLANRLVYEKPRSVRKVLFLDENKYLESTGAGRTLNLRIARDSRKYKVRALVCSQLPDDYLGLDGTDDKSALTYEVFVGDLGSNAHAISGALKLLNLPEKQGYESLLAGLGSGGEDTLDEDTDTSYQDHARRFVVKMADDIEMIRSDWTDFVHLAHVFEALKAGSAG